MKVMSKLSDPIVHLVALFLLYVPALLILKSYEANESLSVFVLIIFAALGGITASRLTDRLDG